MAVAMIGPKFYAWDRNGNPLAFGKLYTYLARTNTPKPTYQSEDQVVENTNPVILNGEGYADVYLDGAYKMVLKDDKDNEIWSSDPVTSAQATEWVNCFTATYVSPTSFKLPGNQTDKYRTGRKVRIDNNTSEYAYSIIVSSSFAGEETSVELVDPVVTTGIINACTSVVSFESSFNSGDVGNVSNYSFANFDKMKQSETIGGEVVELKLGQQLSTGGTSWRVVNTGGVDLGGGLYAKPITSVHLTDFDVGTSDDASKLTDAVLAANNGTLDLDGLSIEISPISVNIDSIAIVSTKTQAEIKATGDPDQESLFKLNTQQATSKLLTENFKVDGDNKCAKGLVVENSITGEVWLSKNVECVNVKQTASTGLASAHYLFGGFELVQFDSPVAKEVLSEGGSLVASGIRSEQNGTAVSKRIIVNNPQITGVRPGNDGDGIALLQVFPFDVLGEYEVNGGRFENCHKRAIKTQCWKSIVREPYVVRTEIHAQFAGNIDIDCQYGNAEIIDPTFDYSSINTFPVNGIVSLFGQRGATADNDGRGTNLTGGTATIRTAGGRVSHLFETATFDAADVVNRISARGFKFNGATEVVCDIRPVASATFNKVVVFDPVFRDCTFEDVSQAFFRLDRSGTGYAFTENANIINCSVLSGNPTLDQSVTTNVGITYNLVERNDNIGTEVVNLYTFQVFNIADNAAYQKVIKVDQNTAVELTVTYSSGAGNNYHAFRKSILTLGNGAGEDLETNLHNLASSFGGWSFAFSTSLVSGVWEITIDKPVGSSAVGGTVQIVAVSAYGVTE